MAKKGSTVENRVYLFKDLAAAYLAHDGTALSSSDPAIRARALRALGDLAHASCVLADTQKLDAEAVGRLVARPLPEERSLRSEPPSDEAGERPLAPAGRSTSTGAAKKVAAKSKSKSKAQKPNAQKKTPSKARRGRHVETG